MGLESYQAIHFLKTHDPETIAGIDFLKIEDPEIIPGNLLSKDAGS